jgi:hypothetical protein
MSEEITNIGWLNLRTTKEPMTGIKYKFLKGKKCE